MSDCIVHLFTISKISQHKLKAGPSSMHMLGSYTVITHSVCSFYDVHYLFSLSIIFCGHIVPTCTNLSVIVIDKPIALGGTVYTSTSMPYIT